MTHAHDHTHRPAGEHPPAGGPIVLDIGDGYGAAIVHCPPNLVGHELHAEPVDGTVSTHTGIWERTVNDRTTVVAVFAELLEGHYLLRHPHDHGRTLMLAIHSGLVTEVSFPSDDAARE